jgi:hypothetical protein
MALILILLKDKIASDLYENKIGDVVKDVGK